MTSMFTWLWWLSSINKAGFSADGLACLTKCFIKSQKFSFVIHPVAFGWPTISLPGGAVIRQCCCTLTLGKTKNGGMWLPMALIPQQTVTNTPLSWDTTEPTCLVPFSAKTFTGLWTVVTPVSSTFQMDSGPKPLASASSRLEKNCWHCGG